MKHASLLSLGVTLAGALARCSCEPEAAPTPMDQVEIVPFEDTRVLSQADRAALQSFEDGVLRFDAPSAALRDLAPLDVVVSGPCPAAPYGLLRLVVEVTTDGDQLSARTLEAPVQLAFRHLHVRATRSTPADAAPLRADPASRWTQALTVPGGGGIPYDLNQTLYDIDDNPDTDYDQVRATGLLYGGLDYTFSIDFDWPDVQEGIDAVEDCLEDLYDGGWLTSLIEGELPCDPRDLLPEVSTGLSFTAGAQADVGLEGVAFLGYSAELPMYDQPLEPIVIEPLVFLPHLGVKATFTGEAASRFTLSYKAEASAGGSIGYSTKHGLSLDGPDFDYDFEAGDVDAVLAAGSSASVGPELSVLLYDFMGPSAGLHIGVRLEADRDATPCYRLIGQVGGSVGVFVGFKELPGFTLIDEKQPFSIVETEFASGDCVPFPAGGELGPHAGEPPLSAFQSPSFTPFAAAYPDTVDGFPVEDLGAQIEWSALTPTVDGRFWLTGSDVEVLQSLEPDGRVVWAKRYTADVDFWDDLNSPKLLLTRAAPMHDTSMLVAAYPYTLLKLTPQGELIWARHFGGRVYRETWLRFTDLIADGAGGFYLAGNVGEDYSSGYLHDLWLLRLDPAGQVLWSRRVSDPGGWQLTARRLALVEGDALVVGDMYHEAGALSRGLALRVSAAGELAWARSVVVDDCGGGDELRLWISSAVPSRDGDFNLGGGVSFSGYTAWVAKITGAGELPWYHSFGTAESAHLGPTLTALVQLPTSGFLAAGMYSGAQTVRDLWLAGLDSGGAVQWARLIGGQQNPANDLHRDDSYPSLSLTQDGGALVAAFTEAVVASEDATWLFKVPARDGRIAFDDANIVSSEASFVAGGSCSTAQPLDLVAADESTAGLAPLGVEVTPVAQQRAVLGASSLP